MSDDKLDDTIDHTKHDPGFDKPTWVYMDDDAQPLPDDKDLGVADPDVGDDDDGDDDIDIAIVDDTPAQDRGRRRKPDPEPVTDAELENYSEGVKKRINALTRNQHDLRREKEAAARERDELRRINRELLNRQREMQGKVIQQGKVAAEAAIAEARRELQKAMEDGDTEAQAAATESVVSARTARDRIAQEEQSYLQEPPEPVEEEIPATNAGSVDQRAAKWQQDNPWFGQDQGMTGYALGLHTQLAASGVEVGSDEYYDQLNTQLRTTFPDKFADDPDDADEPQAQPTPRRRRRSSPVAPVGTSTGPRGRRSVTLTETQVAVAKELGISLKEYAKQFAADEEQA